MTDDTMASHSGWLLMRGGALRRWQNRYFALFAGSPGGARFGRRGCAVHALTPFAGGAPALRYKALPGDAAWTGVMSLDSASVGALPLGDGHPTAACFCAPDTPTSFHASLRPRRR